MFKIKFLLFFTFILLSCSKEDTDYKGSSSVMQIDMAVIIDTDKKYQTIDGFGASDCWTSPFIGEYWTSQREEISKLLFSPDMKNGSAEGIALSMWRVNLGGGTIQQGDDSDIKDITRRAESFLDSDGSYNWDRCEGHKYMLSQAKAMGCKNFVLFSNTPPVQYTKNGKGYSGNGWYANLYEDKYDEFADYITTVLEHYKTVEGVEFNYISPVNEPQYDWGGRDQEGSGWMNYEIAKLIREINSSLVAKSLNTNILVGEAGRWSYLHAGNSNKENVINTFFGSGSEHYIGDLERIEPLISGHSYWNDYTWEGMRNARAEVGEAAAAKGLRLWQTEWSMLGDDYNAQEFVGFATASELDIAMYMSKVIHNDLTVANVTAWNFWTAMAIERWGHKNRFLLINIKPQGGIDGDITQEGSYIATKSLWVLGNYSKFIRPGYKRVDLVTSESRNFFASAWMSDTNDELVVVYTNLSTKAVNMKDEMQNLTQNIESIKIYETSKNSNLREREVVVGEVVISPQSVTTVVYKLN